MKLDSEHAIVALKESAARNAGVEFVPLKESPVGDHQANGLAENACREVKRQVRVLRSALEENSAHVWQMAIRCLHGSGRGPPNR